MPDANRLYIGEGVTIKGEISVPDTLVVCGVLEGDVTVGNLVVGETGAIKGRITVAENAEISGKVFEKLDVKCLLILRSTRRQHCRRAFFHRLSARAAEDTQARSLSAGSEVAETRGFSGRKAGRLVDSGAGDASRRPVNSFFANLADGSS